MVRLPSADHLDEVCSVNQKLNIPNPGNPQGYRAVKGKRWMLHICLLLNSDASYWPPQAQTASWSVNTEFWQLYKFDRYNSQKSCCYLWLWLLLLPLCSSSWQSLSGRGWCGWWYKKVQETGPMFGLTTNIGPVYMHTKNQLLYLCSYIV